MYCLYCNNNLSIKKIKGNIQYCDKYCKNNISKKCDTCKQHMKLLSNTLFCKNCYLSDLYSIKCPNCNIIILNCTCIKYFL